MFVSIPAVDLAGRSSPQDRNFSLFLPLLSPPFSQVSRCMCLFVRLCFHLLPVFHFGVRLCTLQYVCVVRTCRTDRYVYKTLFECYSFVFACRSYFSRMTSLTVFLLCPPISHSHSKIHCTILTCQMLIDVTCLSLWLPLLCACQHTGVHISVSLTHVYVCVTFLSFIFSPPPLPGLILLISLLLVVIKLSRFVSLQSLH